MSTLGVCVTPLFAAVLSDGHSGVDPVPLTWYVILARQTVHMFFFLRKMNARNA